MVSDRLLLTAVTALPMLIGAAVIYKGYTSRQHAATIEETDSTPIGELQADGGLFEIKGRARGRGETSTAVMLDREGVAVTTSVQRRDTRSSPGDNAGRRTVWNEVYGDRTVHDFAVEDDTGSIPVDVPDEGDLTIATQTVSVGVDETPPPAVQRLIDAVDGLEADPDNVRRYSEGVIEEGESLYGLGEPVTDENGQLVFSGEERASEFVVSDLSEEALAKEKAGGGIGAYILGGFFLLMGAGFTALLWVV